MILSTSSAATLATAGKLAPRAVTMADLTGEDHRELERAGIEPAEAERQLRQLRRGALPVRLRRPCTVGDGILALSERRREVLRRSYRDAVRRGRFTKFVPASGAASRMFRSLLRARAEKRELDWQALEAEAGADSVARDLLRLRREVRRFPFHRELEEVLGREPEKVGVRPLLDALLDRRGLNLAALPKGLLPFHAYPGGSRTAFEEHCLEARRYLADSGDVCRLHFTVAEHSRPRFLVAASELQGSVEGRWRIEFSTQRPDTDTLAIDLEGKPFRAPDGRLVLRPGGHGALLGNLQSSGADLLFLKNIDNVLPAGRQPLVAEWKEILGGLLVELQNEVFECLEDLERGRGRGEKRGQELLARRFGWPPEPAPAEGRGARTAERLHSRLDRPLRVCGMVRRAGEPGGGPFWIEGREGATRLAIVEAAEIDSSDPRQRAIAERATHFNPVDLVCALRDREGRPYRLEDFADREAVLITRRSAYGRDLLALERPGLWNGGMAFWNTVFVEVPGATFAPVKSLFDLLRPEHQPGPSEGS